MSRHTPTDAPDGIFERVQQSWFPFRGRRTIVARLLQLLLPNNHGSIFRATRNDILIRQQARRPRHIADPIRVTDHCVVTTIVARGRSRGGGGAVRNPLSLIVAVDPEPHEVVAARRREVWNFGSVGRIGIVVGPVRGPTHGVDARLTIRQVLDGPRVIGQVLENRDAAIRRGRRHHETELVRRKGDAVDRGFVQTAGLVQDGPLSGALFAMNQHAAVKGTGSEEDAKLWVSPRDLPHGTFVTLQGRRDFVGCFRDVVNLDSAVCSIMNE